MKRWMAVLLVGGVFISGVAVGAFGMRIAQRRTFFQRHGGEAFAERMREDLALTAEQSERIARIMRETHEEARALRRSLRPQVEALMQRSAARVEEVLTPEQREVFERLRREHGPRADLFLLGGGRMHGWVRRGRAGPPPGSPRPPPPETPAP